MGIIYRITNSLNGKIYIGQTRQSSIIRWNQHKNKAIKYNVDTVLGAAIRKYGPDNFIVDDIYSVIDNRMLDYYERYFIGQFNSVVPNGYNLTLGGSSGAIPTDDVRRKMSLSALKRFEDITNHPSYGKNVSEETRQKQAAAKLGKSNHRRGIKLSDETKAKIGAASKNRKWSDIQREKFRSSMLGHKTSEETKRKIGLAHRWRWMRENIIAWG